VIVATPSNYIVLIGGVDVLPQLFDDVCAPDAVMRELVNTRTPEPVRAWAANPPDWLEVLEPSSRLPSTYRLDPGEAHAISSAKEINAPAVLLDEKLGRTVELSEGLVVIRTLASLERAAERELIALWPTLERLQATTFRLDRKLIDGALARDTLRRRGGG